MVAAMAQSEPTSCESTMVIDDAASAAAAAVSPATAKVRFVAVPGGGMEHVFPERYSVRGIATAPPAAQLSTIDLGGIAGTAAGFGSRPVDLALFQGRSGSAAGELSDTGEREEMRARTAATQAPELKPSDWASLRSRYETNGWYKAMRLAVRPSASRLPDER